MRHLAVVCFIGSVVVACGAPPASESPEDELYALFEEVWDYQLKEYPTRATAVGVHDYNDRLTSMTLEDIARRNEYAKDVLARLEAIDREALANEARINYDMFRRRIEFGLADYEFNDHLIPITAEGGFHTSFARLPERVPLATTALPSWRTSSISSVAFSRLYPNSFWST